MKTLSIAKKIIFRSLRDVNTMLIMCAMPLVLIFVLGLAFDTQIGTDTRIDLDEMHITYSVVGEPGQISEGIEGMMDELLTEGSTYVEAEDKEEQIEKLRTTEITAYVEIDENTSTIVYYKNNKVNTSSSILETALRSFAARYNTIYEIAKVNPMALQGIVSDDVSGNYIEEIGLDEKYQPSAMDYYGVVMAALFVLYGFMTPLDEEITDKSAGMTARIATTAIKPTELFTGKVLGYVTVSSIRTGIVILISRIAYGVNWGDKPIYPLLVILALIVIMTSLGMLLGEFFKSVGAAAAASHMFIAVTAFFGGAYMALEDLGPIAEVGKYFSVIWWVNSSITAQIYSNDYSNMIKTFIIFGSLSILFFGISVLIMRRRRVNIYG
ncbi:MAG: ABC transporter permease [Clostridia bacterium]|nr:ABC transporter permease [Clostridia bacterium]